MDEQLIDTTAADPAPTVAPTAGRPGRSRRGFAVLAGVAAVVLTVGASAALAASPAPSSAPTAAPTTGTAQAQTPASVDPAAADAAFKAYAACMKDHGVDLPVPALMTSTATASGDPGAGTPGAGGPVSVDGGVPVVIEGSGPVTIVGSAGAGATTAGPMIVVGSGDAAAIGTQFDPATWQAADAACSSILEAAGIHASTGTIVTNGADLTGPVPGSGAAGTAGAGIIGIGVAGGGDTAKLADGMRAYAACLRSRGVDQPDPVVDAATGSVQMTVTADPSSAAFRAADTACASDAFPGFPAAPAPETVTTP